jgi:hypothetical protein
LAGSGGERAAEALAGGIGETCKQETLQPGRSFHAPSAGRTLSRVTLNFRGSLSW